MGQPTSLAVPLLSAHIDAAVSLQTRMPLWRETNRAFQILHKCVPGFELSVALLKVAAVNQLYSTNVYAVARMAEQVVSVTANPPADPLRVVERIAALPPTADQKRDRKHWSFALKFVHFFVDDRCPIYDSYAIGMVAFHLGRGKYAWNESAPYSAFVANYRRLQQLAGLSCSAGEYDTYLWITGQYREWCRKRDNAEINTEARKLFMNQSDEVTELLHTLLPTENHPVLS